MDLNQDINQDTRKTLIVLQAGTTTTPKWLFQKFSDASLTRHGIRKLDRKLYVRSVDGTVHASNDQFYVVGTTGDLARTVSELTPITYHGFKKWGVEEI